MTVKELIEDLKKVQSTLLLTFENILKCDGFGVRKVVEVNCNEDSDISNVYLVEE